MAKHLRVARPRLMASGFALVAVAAAVLLLFLGGASAGDAGSAASRSSSEIAEVLDVAASDEEGQTASVAASDAALSAGQASEEAEDNSLQAGTAGDGGSYATGEVLVTLDSSLGEDELRARLAETGVSVTSVETVSTALEGDEVLVLVGYEGDEDAAELSERLAGLDIVSSAQPDYIYMLAEDDVVEADAGDIDEAYGSTADADAVQVDADETTSNNNASAGDSAQEANTAGDAGEAAEAADATDAAEEAGADDTQASTASVSTNDPYRASQWEHDSIGLSEAWDAVKCENTVTVAVIDSGVDYDHPDLAANLLLDYAKNCATDRVGGAAVDDQNGHGTHVAGIIAAVANNGTGIAGTSYNANILPVSVMSGGSNKTSTSCMIKALDYVVSLKKAAATEALANIRVVNLSLGGDENDEELNAAVQRTDAAGIVVVAAAGNHDNTINGGRDYTCYPAAYNNVIAVGNLCQSGSSVAISSGSNKGSFVDISAPGTSIYSTYCGGRYATLSGTSMASPVVSAVAALVCAADPSVTTDEVESVLTETALDLGTTGRDNSYGYGEVQADAAVAKALGVSTGTSSESDEDGASSGGSDSGGGEDSAGGSGPGADEDSDTDITDPATPTTETQAMYRLYNPNSGEHFYTASETERDMLEGVGWDYEGVGWTAPKSSNTPVYRLYNPNEGSNGSGEHHYTTSEAEKNDLVAAGWTYEGIGWYSDDGQAVPLHRLYNPNAFNNNHHYTTSTVERDYLHSLGWRIEGIAWYGV